jgi:hypothetical protein
MQVIVSVLSETNKWIIGALAILAVNGLIH